MSIAIRRLSGVCAISLHSLKRLLHQHGQLGSHFISIPRHRHCLSANLSVCPMCKVHLGYSSLENPIFHALLSACFPLTTTMLVNLDIGDPVPSSVDNSVLLLTWCLAQSMC